MDAGGNRAGRRGERRRSFFTHQARPQRTEAVRAGAVPASWRPGVPRKGGGGLYVQRVG